MEDSQAAEVALADANLEDRRAFLTTPETKLRLAQDIQEMEVLIENVSATKIRAESLVIDDKATTDADLAATIDEGTEGADGVQAKRPTTADEVAQLDAEMRALQNIRTDLGGAVTPPEVTASTVPTPDPIPEVESASPVPAATPEPRTTAAPTPAAAPEPPTTDAAAAPNSVPVLETATTVTAPEAALETTATAAATTPEPAATSPEPAATAPEPAATAPEMTATDASATPAPVLDPAVAIADTATTPAQVAETTTTEASAAPTPAPTPAPTLTPEPTATDAGATPTPAVAPASVEQAAAADPEPASSAPTQPGTDGARDGPADAAAVAVTDAPTESAADAASEPTPEASAPTATATREALSIETPTRAISTPMLAIPGSVGEGQDGVAVDDAVGVGSVTGSARMSPTTNDYVIDHYVLLVGDSMLLVTCKTYKSAVGTGGSIRYTQALLNVVDPLTDKQFPEGTYVRAIHVSSQYPVNLIKLFKF